MNWYLVIVLIYISLMTNAIEYLFVCLLGISISSMGKIFFKFFAHFLNLGVCFVLLLKVAFPFC